VGYRVCRSTPRLNDRIDPCLVSRRTLRILLFRPRDRIQYGVSPLRTCPTLFQTGDSRPNADYGVRNAPRNYSDSSLSLRQLSLTEKLLLLPNIILTSAAKRLIYSQSCDSSVGIATGYGLDRSGFDSWRFREVVGLGRGPLCCFYSILLLGVYINKLLFAVL
jgi:hypothetical protein